MKYYYLLPYLLWVLYATPFSTRRSNGLKKFKPAVLLTVFVNTAD